MQQESAFMVVDPVCGMEIRTDEAAATSEFQGTTYYFCTTSCKEQFDENPAHYLKREEAA